jgi:hypothetical protein
MHKAWVVTCVLTRGSSDARLPLSCCLAALLASSPPHTAWSATTSASARNPRFLVPAALVACPVLPAFLGVPVPWVPWDRWAPWARLALPDLQDLLAPLALRDAQAPPALVRFCLCNFYSYHMILLKANHTPLRQSRSLFSRSLFTLLEATP